MTAATLRTCACGCGLVLTPGKRWARGHHNRGTPQERLEREARGAKQAELRRVRAAMQRELTGAPPGSPAKLTPGARTHHPAGREPSPTAGAERLSGAIDALVQVLGAVAPEVRERALRQVLVEIRSGLYRLDVERGLARGFPGVAEELEDDEELRRPGPGAHGRGKGGRTEREPRHRGPHEWHWNP